MLEIDSAVALETSRIFSTTIQLNASKELNREERI